MAAPTVPASGSTVSAATDMDGPVTAATPAGASASSTLVAFQTTTGDVDISALTAPDGWVSWGEMSGGSTVPNAAVWARLPDGATPAASYEFSKPVDTAGVVTVLAVDGLNAESPVDVAVTWLADCDDTDTMPAPSVTSQTADTLVVNLFAAATSSVSAPPPPDPTPDPTPETLSLFWSGSEIDVARSRVLGADTFEWTAVEASANAFWAAPTGSMLAGFNPMACGGGATADAQRQAVDAAQFANRVSNAVTVELATGRTDRLATIRSSLVTQMGVANFDFHNRTKYPLNCTDNIAPGFHLCMYVGKLIYTMDTLKVLGVEFSAGDLASINQRLHGLAEIGCKDATTKMNQFYSSAAARAARSAPAAGTPHTTVFHYDGAVPRVSGIGLALNNRRAKPITYAAVAQAWTGDKGWDSHIRLWCQDMLDYGYAPEYGVQPGMVDMYRGWQQAAEGPWKGAHYTSATVAPLGLVAEMYRRGFADNWLWGYRTTRGLAADRTTKTVKAYGVLDAIQHFCSYAWGWRAVRMGGLDFGTSWVTTGYEDLDNAFVPEEIRPAIWNGGAELARTNVVATRGRGAQPMYQAYEMIPAVWFLRAPR